MNDRTVWSIHFKPLCDEQLSSWLARLAQANGFRVGRFCRAVWGWDSEFCQNRDFDRGTNDQVIDTLSLRTGIAPAHVWFTTLRAYEGFLVERFNFRSPTMTLILPAGLHPAAANRGFQFCPRCFSEDSVPYYRRLWRVACVTVCTRHMVMLVDRCPKCGRSPNFGRMTQGRKWADEELPQSFCSHCQYDLRKAAPKSVEPEVMRYMVKKQLLMEEALRSGFIQMPGLDALYSHQFFKGFRILLRMLTSPRVGHRLEWLLAQKFPVMESRETTDYDGDFELQSIDLRFKLVYWTWQLLEEWPIRFVCWSQGMAIFGSEIVCGVKEVPYWLARVVSFNLSKHHSPNPKGFPARHRFPVRDIDGNWINWKHRFHSKVKMRRDSFFV